VVFADLDHFKSYNDTHGHPAGDRLLKTVAEIFVGRARQSTLVARYGGEEFVFLVPETEKTGAVRYADAMREIIEDHPFPGREAQPEGKVTLSLGVAGFPDDGIEGQSLIAHADRSLYRAKEEGRNRVCW
jgi:diguanylate cyclase (GGDEF)-like protein